MKRLLITFVLILAVTVGFSQVTRVGSGKTVMVATFSISGLSGDDTSFVFAAQEVSYWSLQTVLTDTIEGDNAVGVWLYGSNDGTSWATLTDSLSFAVTTYPQGKFFTGGSGFPYVYGKVLVKKNGATDGDGRLIWYGY